MGAGTCAKTPCATAKFRSDAELEFARRIKEKFCYVALDYASELKAAEENPGSVQRRFELPTDGGRTSPTTLVFGSERFRCAEVLFQPGLLGKEQRGSIHEVILRAVQSCTIDMRQELFR